ncbi:hypothetical protein NDU88_001770 [Pleurodeles waltl]|uniref:Uncharacterized protein n=1 Tax=Pleurodeles waltl TaxID=8319 RepID=A0AAV7WJC7_PLEWA|nr:hypothetical protein NDU88_001770 [Pleurodeles waltl]
MDSAINAPVCHQTEFLPAPQPAQFVVHTAQKGGHPLGLTTIRVLPAPCHGIAHAVPVFTNPPEGGHGNAAASFSAAHTAALISHRLTRAHSAPGNRQAPKSSVGNFVSTEVEAVAGRLRAKGRTEMEMLSRAKVLEVKAKDNGFVLAVFGANQEGGAASWN